MSRRFGLAALAVAFALVAAACGDDDTTVDEQESSTTEAAETSAPPDTVTDDTTAPETTAEPAPNTASFRGVTPDTIKIGLAQFDWDRLTAIGVDLGRTNSDDIYEAALESINERGGIHGRMLDIHTVIYMPVGDTEADAACIEFTEDQEVFMVVGTTLSDEIMCIVEAHETAAIVAAGMNEDRKARAKAPYVTVGVETEERSQGFVQAMDELGILEGATVGVTGSPDVSVEAYNTVVEAFRDIGIDPVEGLTGDNDEDLLESANEAAVVYERFRSSGVDTAVLTTGVPLELANAISADYDTDQWLLRLIMTPTGLLDAGVDPSIIDGAYAVVETPQGSSLQPEMANDPLVSECVDSIEEATGRTITYELNVEQNDIAAALGACSIAIILERALTDAGPDLTNDSLREAIGGIGDIDLPARKGAHLGPGDFSAGSDLTTVTFDAEEGLWKPVE